ncbi:MAG: YdbH domain-containing protein, partial [Halioglobus sp.]|nr:YdbH domain-containing protein [Halioglobus sp.]
GEAPRKQLQAEFQLSSEIGQLDIRGIASDASGTVAIEGKLNEGEFRATLQPFKLTGNIPTQALSLPDNWVTWMRLGEVVPIHLDTAETTHITSPAPGSWSVRVGNALLSLGEKDSTLSARKLDLEVTALDTEQLEFSSALSASLNIHLRKQTFPTLEIEFAQHGGLQKSGFELRVADSARSLHTDLKGTLDLTSGRGTYQLTAQVTDLPSFWAKTAPLLRHFGVLNSSVELRSGSIRLHTDIQSKSFDTSTWEQRSRLAIKDTAGSLDDLHFEGLALSADWSGIARWKTLQPLVLSLATFNPGFAIKDIELQVSLPKATAVARPQMRVDAFSAELFGGRLILPAAQAWDFAAPSNSITLQAKQWQLGELVALQQNAEIQAQGTLEGELPLTISDGRIIIDKGYLRALPPGGSIRYTPTDGNRALARHNPDLELALDLLSDFQYQVLSSEVSLDKSGNLLLGLSLAGSNPTLYEGQAVNFNINVEQKIDPLLQTLQLSDNLLERIETGLK